MKNDRDIENIINGAGDADSKNKMREYLLKKLNAEQTRKLDEIMRDENAVNEILSTPEAQKILKKIAGEKDGERK